MSYGPSDIIGIIGVAMIIAAYFFLQAERWKANSRPYLYFNIVGSSLVLVSLWFDFNFPSVVIQLFWIAISVMGLVRARRRRGAGGWR